VSNPTGRELWGGIDAAGHEYDEVDSRLTGTWRWGSLHETVYRRGFDDTYWAMRYRIQTDEGIDWGSVAVSRVQATYKTTVVKLWEDINTPSTTEPT
jgi:hypothetical protein